jgi:hypothetical protein
MATSQRDLWPADISVLPELRTPVTILREQASILGEKTNNIVEAEVRSQGDKNSQFIHSFFLLAPALDNYRYQLFTATHKVELYPITINFFQTQFQASNEEKLIEILTKIFADEKTKKVIQALIAQSRS